MVFQMTMVDWLCSTSEFFPTAKLLIMPYLYRGWTIANGRVPLVCLVYPPTTRNRPRSIPIRRIRTHLRVCQCLTFQLDSLTFQLFAACWKPGNRDKCQHLIQGCNNATMAEVGTQLMRQPRRNGVLTIGHTTVLRTFWILFECCLQ